MRALVRILLFLGLLFWTAVALFFIVHRDRRPAIYFAAEGGDTNALAQYLARGSNVNDAVICYVYGVRTAPLLHIAASSGQSNAVRLLLKKEANPNLQDFSGDTALLAVIGRGENEAAVQVLRMLLKAGADPNLKSSSRFWTPLILSSDLGEAQIVRALLAGGADVHATNRQGSTPLHFAGNAEVARLLIAAGADRAARAGGADGETPADSAVRLGHFDALTVITNVATPEHE
jgi:ankyrin repeat protein